VLTRSDAEALALLPQGAAQVVKLRTNESVNPVTRFADRLPNAFLDLVRGEPLKEVLAA
jgi:hypothetical protein